MPRSMMPSIYPCSHMTTATMSCMLSSNFGVTRQIPCTHLLANCPSHFGTCTSSVAFQSMALFMVKPFPQLMNFVVLALMENPGYRQATFNCSPLFTNLQEEQKMFELLTGLNFCLKAQVDISCLLLESTEEEFHSPSGVIDNNWTIKTKDTAKPFLDMGVDETLRDETYLAAFLSCWICKFLLPRHKIDHICLNVFNVASLMAHGQKFSLVVPILSSIYNA
ncbi:hypothetical protein ACH5RR_012721 [Cinchona calisaya]|uniref:Aminotransferase-like plant mobile domain-containing protein n=1 Tax=Cinchona calisaya TaxID=153742 RepID=A0ABD3A8E5_9GENT